MRSRGEIGPVRHGVELVEPEGRGGETRSASTEEENEGYWWTRKNEMAEE